MCVIDRKIFSLIELLVVIAIIAILASLLQPSMVRAIENANQVLCMNKMRNIGYAFMLYSEDHFNALPATSRGGSEPWQANFYGSKHISDEFSGLKQVHMYRDVEGPIWDYLNVNSHQDLFRCPSLEQIRIGSGVGSNGLFDYCGFEIFGGAKTHNIPSSAYMHDPRDEFAGKNAENPNLAEMQSVPTPMIVEEDPLHHVNRGWEEVSHGSIDQMGVWHGNASIYAATDGSAHRVEFMVRGPKPKEWRIEHHSRGIIDLHSSMQYGKWND